MKNRVQIIYLILLSANTLFASEGVPEKLFPEIEGWQLSEPKVWNADNLYVPINGAADMYLAYHFEEMQAADYLKDSSYISVEVYRHASPVDAFGAYSQERPRSDSYITIGAQGYKGSGYIHFISDRYYIKIRTSISNPSIDETMLSIAQKQAEILPDHSTYPLIFKSFPAENKVVYSERYINENIFGYTFLHSSYEVDYAVNDLKYTLFILKGHDQADAENMLIEYNKVLGISQNEFPDGYYTIDDRYTGNLKILKSGSLLLCSRGDLEDEKSLALLAQWQNSISLKPDK